MKVRIKATPHKHEVDGVKLEGLMPGSVLDVSPTLGSWLIAEGYALPEMRSSAVHDAEFDSSSFSNPLDSSSFSHFHVARERRGRKS